MIEYAQVLDRLDEVLRRLDSLTAPQQPPLTRVEFAKLVGVSPRTVYEWIKSRKIQTKKGRIPYSEARKFLS